MVPEPLLKKKFMEMHAQSYYAGLKARRLIGWEKVIEGDMKDMDFNFHTFTQLFSDTSLGFGAGAQAICSERVCVVSVQGDKDTMYVVYVGMRPAYYTINEPPYTNNFRTKVYEYSDRALVSGVSIEDADA